MIGLVLGFIKIVFLWFFLIDLIIGNDLYLVKLIDILLVNI